MNEKLYKVKSQNRIVVKTELIGEDRWLCTDYRFKTHPCYNERNLEEIKPFDICLKVCEWYNDSCQYSMCEDCDTKQCDGTCAAVECYYGDEIDEIITKDFEEYKERT